MSRPIFVAGATGKQGSALIHSLTSSPTFSSSQHTIYALTRDPTSSSSQRLASLSPAINLIKGNWTDAPSALKTLPSTDPASPTSPRIWGAFILTMPGKTERADGIALIDASISAGAKHIVFTSVERGSANAGFNPTNVPHFTTKHEIESHLMNRVSQLNGSVTYTVLRPVFFLDNLAWGFLGRVLSTIWRDNLTVPLQVVDTKDIGRLAAKAFLHSGEEEYRNTAISVAGDQVTFDEADEIFRGKTGKGVPVAWGIWGRLLLWVMRDIRLMFEFFERPGYQADIGKVKRLLGGETTGVGEWVEGSTFGGKGK